MCYCFAASLSERAPDVGWCFVLVFFLAVWAFFVLGTAPEVFFLAWACGGHNQCFSVHFRLPICCGHIHLLLVCLLSGLCLITASGAVLLTPDTCSVILDRSDMQGCPLHSVLPGQDTQSCTAICDAQFSFVIRDKQLSIAVIHDTQLLLSFTIHSLLVLGHDQDICAPCAVFQA